MSFIKSLFIKEEEELPKPKEKVQVVTEDFEKRAKPIMTDMKVEKQAKEDEAMKMLEDLLKQDSIKLPDYQRFSATGAMSKVAETIPFENKYNL